MELFKFLILCLIYKVNSIHIGRKDYKILKGRKALLNVTLTARAHSAIECATKCAKRNDCNHANFGNSQCEFLNYETPGVEIEFEDQPSTKFICKCVFNISFFFHYFIYHRPPNYSYSIPGFKDTM